MLDKPVTAKESEWGPQNGLMNLSWSSSSMQGWRTGMEDAHVCVPALPDQALRGVALFGVFDGHGGEQVAKFCAKRITEEVCTALRGLGVDESCSGVPPESWQVGEALVRAFHRIDELLCDPDVLPELKALTNPPSDPAKSPRPAAGRTSGDPRHVGCTANVCCVTPTHIIVANAGDSRAVLCRKGDTLALSMDHKPNDPKERKRIEAAGGYVENSAPGVWRVNGNLNLSRALGDLEYKKDRLLGPQEQIISGTPDIMIYDRSYEDEFIAICCDGVWDVKSNKEVVDFVRNRLPVGPQAADQQGAAETLEMLLDSCLSPNLRQTRGLGGDNMTAVLVRFPHDEPCPDVAQAFDDAAEEPAAEPPAVGTPAMGFKEESFSLEAGDERWRTAGDAAVDGCLPCLGSAQLEPADVSTQEAGSLTLRLQLPVGWSLSGLSLRVDEVRMALELGYDPAGSAGSGGAVPWIFNLREHLPLGAALELPAEGCESLAKLIKKTQTLRIRLPWRFHGPRPP